MPKDTRTLAPASMPTFRPTRCAVILPLALGAVFATGAFAAPTATTQAADDCIAAPNSPAPQGKHWYYRTDRVKQRKCWYLGQQGKKVQKTTPQSADVSSAPPASAPPAATPAETGSTAQIGRTIRQAAPPANHGVVGASGSAADRSAAWPAPSSGMSDADAASPAFGLRPPAPARTSASADANAIPAPLGPAPGSVEAVSPDRSTTDRALSGYPVVATPDATAAFEPIIRTAEPVAAQEDTPPAQASSATADDTNGGLAATPSRMLLLLAGALAIAGILVTTFRIAAARRRRIRVDKREVVWNLTYDRPGPNPAAPDNEDYPHDDVEKTLREILRACGHRAA